MNIARIMNAAAAAAAAPHFSVEPLAVVFIALHCGLNLFYCARASLLLLLPSQNVVGQLVS